jgi:hypothetical protein
MKKISYIFLLFTSIVSSQGINSGLFFSQGETNSSNLKKVTITFDEAPTVVNVHKAYYKYDKEFAFSFGLDDGLVGQYRVALPMFNGGTIVHETGNTPNYPGLFYTDGTGNNKPFSATLNINMSQINIDTNPTSTLNEFMLKDFYVKNFSLTNHSWSAKNQFTAPGFSSDPTIRNQEILFEITENYEKLKEKFGIKMPNFTAPSNDPIYDAVTIDLVDSGYLKLVNNINNSNNQFGHSPNRYAEYWIAKKALGLSRDFNTWKDNTITRTASDFDFINALLEAAVLDDNQHVWITLATHRINLGETKTTNGPSIRYESFKWIMEGLESNYGRYGQDNMWMATIDAVYEYLKCVENTNIVQSQNENTVTLSIDFSEVDSEFKEHSLSLLIDADTNITNIEYEGFDKHSHATNYKNLGTNNALINVEYKPEYEHAVYSKLEALIAVKTLENTQSQADLDISKSIISALRSGNFKDSLQTRIDRVLVIKDAHVIQIDFGRGINGYELIYPWNSFTNTGIGLTVGSKLMDLSTTNSVQSGIDIEVTAAFEGYDANFSGEKGDSLSNFPYEAERDCFKTPNGLASTLRLTNLDENKLYDFTIFCSRNFVGTETEMTINGENVSVGHKNNLYSLISIKDVVPNTNGILDIDIKGTGSSNVYGFLNVMQITEKNPK